MKSFRLQPENETIASKHDQTNVKERQITTVPWRNIMNDMQRLPWSGYQHIESMNKTVSKPSYKRLALVLFKLVVN